MQVRIQSMPSAQADQQRRPSLRTCAVGNLFSATLLIKHGGGERAKRVQGEKRLDSARLSSARRMRVCYFRSPDYFGCGRLVPAEGNAEARSRDARFECDGLRQPWLEAASQLLLQSSACPNRQDSLSLSLLLLLFPLRLDLDHPSLPFLLLSSWVAGTQSLTPTSHHAPCTE